MKYWPVVTLATGLVILLGAPLGLFGTSLAMMQSFGQLGQNGISDPVALADHIGHGLSPQVAGFSSLWS